MTLQALVETGRIQREADLGALTTYRLGGPSSYFLDVATSEDLRRVSAALSRESHPILILGRGSNLVISERGFDGLVLRLGPEFGEINLGRADGTVTVGGLASLPQVARAAASAGKRGLEFLIGVPGSTGGGVRQNAGCFGSEVADVLEAARIFDLATGVESQRAPANLEMSYRHTSVASTEVVLSALFKVTDGDASEGLDLIREHARWRRLHQPGGTLNAGSVFKNPPGDSAGRIIDALGLKGLRVGGAEVSTKHANFFVAMPGARASHVYLLVKEVARRVEIETGTILEPELQFVGEFESEP